MLTLASWYQKNNWRGKPMRISNTAGRQRGLKKSVYDWGEVRCLIPNWELVKAYRDRQISKEEYTTAYMRGLQDRWIEVQDWLATLSDNQDITLLCHEPEGEFCHRHLVAELVKEHRPDIPVTLH